MLTAHASIQEGGAWELLDRLGRVYVDPGFDFPALRTGDRELGPLLGFTGGGSLRIAVGGAARPRSWVLGLDLNVTETRYLDDIFISQRLSTVGALSVEAEF